MTLAELQALRDEQIKNELEAIAKRIEAGTASYADAQRFSGTVGRVVGDIMSRAVCIIFPQGKADRETIERFLPPMLRDNYTLITSITTQVQEALNRKAGLRLKAAKPTYNKNRVQGLVTELVDAEQAAEKAPVIAQQIENATRSIVDDFVKTNVAAHYRAGLRPKITRTAVGKCCQWCNDLAGVYSYPDVPEDVYRRHSNCNCLVTYDPADGTKQDVWSKARWSGDDPADRIAAMSQASAQRKEKAQSRAKARKERDSWVKLLMQERGMSAKQAGIYYNMHILPSRRT